MIPEKMNRRWSAEGFSFEHYDDSYREEKGIDDADEGDRNARGHDKLVGHDSRIVNGEDCYNREHDGDDGTEHQGEREKKSS
jgi:hypothetical protein